MQPRQHAQRTTGRLGTVRAPGVPSLTDLLAGVRGDHLRGPWQSTLATSLACQFHKLEPGGLWFAVPPGTTGEKVRLAIRRGASAVLAEAGAVLPDRTTLPVVRVRDARTAMAKATAAFFGSPAQDLRLVGVTGANGKGTVALLLRSMLDAVEAGGGRRAGYIGMLNADATTPEPPELHYFLDRANRPRGGREESR